MTEEDIVGSPLLGQVVLSMLTTDSTFKELFKTSASSIASEIESASTNPSCTCKTKVISYVTANAVAVGTLVYKYGVENNTLADVKALFDAAATAGLSAIGRVAKTSIGDWPKFTKGIREANITFDHMSTSIVGEDVYVFFM